MFVYNALMRVGTKIRSFVVLTVLLLYIVASSVISWPVLINPTLRSNYTLLLAHWRSKLIRPSYVFIGDSMVASGGIWGWRLGYDPLSAINLGENRLRTHQIAIRATLAAKYRPDVIVVMAGTNDAIQTDHLGEFDEARLREAWQDIFSAAGSIRVIVTLAPFTDNPAFNRRIAEINYLVESYVANRHVTVIDLNPDIAPKGVIEPRYTVDGVHFTDAAYSIWARKLNAALHAH